MTNSAAAAQLISSHLPASQTDRMRSLIHQSMFWRPDYMAKSAWLEHVPFAFWIVEAHRPRVIVELGTHAGMSYFSFCQAVDRLGLDTRCFAVDTWKGDEHAGFYPKEIFAAVKRHNDEHYSGFSRLVPSTFDAAAEHFSPGFIDLLHIDGLHTLESVSHDFQTWLPKLSDDGIVLMHDTNVRERGFGVSTFFESIQNDYPNFEFLHGHGLGVVCVGKNARASVESLLEANQDPALRYAVRELFGRLGRGVADGFSLREDEKRINQLQTKLSGLDSNLKATRSEKEGLEQSLQKTIAALKNDVAAKDAGIAKLEKTVEEYARTLDSRFFELAKLTGDIEQARNELERREQSLRKEIEGLGSDVSSRNAEIARLEKVIEDYGRALDSRLFDLAKLGGNTERTKAKAAALRADKKSRELARYARKLERQHVSVLKSTSWRAMEPVRGLLRMLRGQRKPPVFLPRL